MYCEKYRCVMNESACIARQRKMSGAIGRGRRKWKDHDPGCVNCEQGRAVMKYENRRKAMENKEYKPFGKEWVKEMMKFKKRVLIDMYRTLCLENEKMKNRRQIS